MSKMNSLVSLVVLIATGVGCWTAGKSTQRASSAETSPITSSNHAAKDSTGPTTAPATRPAASGNLKRQDVRHPDVGRSFESHRLAIEHYESQGLVTLGQFADSRWPARVVHVKEARDEIRVTLKKGGPHQWPDQAGYRLKAVFLEDPAGKETVLIFRSVEKMKPVRPAGELR